MSISFDEDYEYRNYAVRMNDEEIENILDMQQKRADMLPDEAEDTLYSQRVPTL